MQSTAPRRSWARTPITALAEAIPGIALWAEQRGPSEHELCGRTSFSVTTIRGGSGINTIPADCVAGFDWRLHPSDDAESARVELTAHLAESAPRVSLATVFLQDEGLDLDLGEPLVAAVRAASARITGIGQVAGLRADTDASKFARAGVPRSCSARARWRKPTPPASGWRSRRWRAPRSSTLVLCLEFAAAQ